MRSALAGASIGAAFAVGFVFANPVVVGALTNVFGNLAAAAINGQVIDFGSLLIDAVIGGLFGWMAVQNHRFGLVTPEDQLSKIRVPGVANGYYTWLELQHLRNKGFVVKIGLI